MKSKLKALFKKLPKRQSEWLQGSLWHIRAWGIVAISPLIRMLLRMSGGKGIFESWPRAVVELIPAESTSVHTSGVRLFPVIAKANTLGDAKLEDFADQPVLPPSFSLVELHGAAVDGGTSAVFDKKGQLVIELSQYSKCSSVDRPWDHPIFRQFGRVLHEKIDGCCVLLASPNGAVYFHWLLELFPRILLMKQMGVLPEQFRCLIGNDSGFVRECLTKAGISPEQVILMEKGKRYKVDTLLTATDFHPQASSAHLSPLLKEVFLSDSEECSVPKKKLLYISRRDAGLRIVQNESQLIGIVERLGGEVVTLEDLSVSSQADLFYHADCLVTPHGSALANLVFCRKHTKILELFSPAYVRVLYPRIGTALELDYWYLIGKGEKEKHNRPQLYASIDVDPDLFESTLIACLKN